MRTYIINPPIRAESDYYRDDDAVVERILHGQSMLVPGLRRSGKTSFLWKVARRAETAGRPQIFIDLPNLLAADNLGKIARETARRIQAAGDAVVLLDEAEAFKKHQEQLLVILSACRGRAVAITCAPELVLELNQYVERFQDYVEGLQRHVLGPLTWVEAVALLRQTKAGDVDPVGPEVVERVKQDGDRLPIVLQALGEQHAGGLSINVSLAGVGTRILRGLTPRGRAAFAAAAHGEQVSGQLPEVKLLLELGALRFDPEKQRIEVAGRTLSDIVRDSSESVSPSVLAVPGVTRDAEPWSLRARILHLSDLHFGPHCVEKDGIDLQFRRLRTALENAAIYPDFVVVTGDLSWSGSRDELRLAEDFLESVVGWLAPKLHLNDRRVRDRIILIPGNHEAAWSLSGGLDEAKSPMWSCYSLAPFASLVHRFHKGQQAWNLEQPCHKRAFKEPPVAFVGISTSHFITQERRGGEFGDAVQEEVVRLLESAEMKAAQFRIGLIHHNLRQFHKDGPAIVDVEGAMLQFGKCKPGLDLILHGHVHQGEVNSFVDRARGEVHYSAVGSFGVRADHRPGDNIRGRVSNEFSIVALEVSGTGRRFSTQFYRLEHTTTGEWEWHRSDTSPPKQL